MFFSDDEWRTWDVRMKKIGMLHGALLVTDIFLSATFRDCASWRRPRAYAPPTALITWYIFAASALVWRTTQCVQTIKLWRARFHLEVVVSCPGMIASDAGTSARSSKSWRRPSGFVRCCSTLSIGRLTWIPTWRRSRTPTSKCFDKKKALTSDHATGSPEAYRRTCLVSQRAFAVWQLVKSGRIPIFSKHCTRRSRW